MFLCHGHEPLWAGLYIHRSMAPNLLFGVFFFHLMLHNSRPSKNGWAPLDVVRFGPGPGPSVTPVIDLKFVKVKWYQSVPLITNWALHDFIRFGPEPMFCLFSVRARPGQARPVGASKKRMLLNDQNAFNN